MASITLEERTKLINLYVGMFSAAPGATNLSAMVQDYEAGKTFMEIAEGLDNADFRAEYPAFLTAQEFADRVITNLLGDNVPAGAKSWATNWIIGKVNAGVLTDAQIIWQAVNALSVTDNANYTTAQTVLTNQVTVAEYYSITKSLSSDDISVLQSVIAGVTADTATVDTAKASVDVTAGEQNSKTFTLTTGVDTGSGFTGGSGNDTFIAVDNNTASVGTLNAGDSLDGGTGADTLSIAASGTPTNPIISTANIETLSIVNNAGNQSWNASLMSGLDKLKVTGGTGTTTITSSQGILDVEAVNTNFGITTTSATPTTGAADSMTVTLNGAGTTTDMTITSDGIETMNVVLSTAASGNTTAGSEKAVTLASNTLEKVVVTGDVAASLVANLTGTDSAGEVAVFDASAATGNITANITAGDSTELSVTGGSGDDKFTVGALDSDYTITGGDGTDTLVASAGTYVSGTKLGANVSGFEKISAASAGSVDLNNIANDTFVATDGAGTYSKAGAGIVDSYLSSGNLTLTRLTDTSADTLNVHYQAAADTTYATLSLANEETVTIDAGGTGSNVTHTVTTFTATDLTSLTVTGANALSLATLTGETKLATVDASANTGKSFTINAGDSEVAMTVKGGAGSPTTVGAKVNDITTGKGADDITTYDQADNIVSGLGNDTIVAGGGNDTINSSNGNDSIMAGDGNDTISAGTGNDYIDGGAGNDSIDAGSGTDTVLGGEGNDWVKVGITDNTSVDGGAGSDRVANTAGTITSTTASSVAGALISIADSAAPTLTGVETLYALIDGDSSNASAANTVTLDLTKAADLTTLFLGTDETTNDGSYIKVNNFAGSAVTLYGGITGTTEEIEFLTLDGAGQASLTVNLENFNGSGATDALTVTGVNGLTIAGKSKSQFTGSATQDNLLGDITAASVESFTVSTSGSASTGDGADALVIDDVTANLASSMTITVGANDDLAMDQFIADGDAMLNATVTLGVDSILDVDALNFDAASLDKFDLTVDDGAFVANDGTNTTIVSTEYVDVTATSIDDFNITLDPGAKATLDLSGIYIADLDASLDSSSSLVLKNSLGAASQASNFNFTGRGDLDVDNGSSLGNHSIALLGSTVVFNTSGLTLDTDGMSVHSSASTSSTITTGLGADEVSGGAGNDTISTGDGNDRVGLTGRTETFTIATSGDVDAAETIKFTLNGVDTATTAYGASVTAAATAMATAVNNISETAFVTATSNAGVVTVTYLQYFGTAGTATEVAADADGDMTTTVAVTAAGDNAGADSITTGEGQDTILAGSGNDTITLTETTAVADQVDFVASGSSYDTITGFKTTTDKLSFNGITADITATSGTAIAADAAAGNVVDGAVYVWANGADGTGAEAIADYADKDDVAAFIAAAFSDEAANDEFVAIINDLAADKTYLYLVDFDSGNGGAGAIDDEAISLIGVITEVAGAAIVSGDIN